MKETELSSSHFPGRAAPGMVLTLGLNLALAEISEWNIFLRGLVPNSYPAKNRRRWRWKVVHEEEMRNRGRHIKIR